MKHSNKIVVNLNKVSHARLQWVANNYGMRLTREIKPENETINGRQIFPWEKIWKTKESALHYAKRRGLLDVWYPELELQLSNNHSLIYTGDKALSLWEAWCAKIFGKGKEKK